MNDMRKFLQSAVVVVGLAFLASGCATGSKMSSGKGETLDEQLDAAGKVIGGMGSAASGDTISRDDMTRAMRDVKSNPESRSALESIMGGTPASVLKYSPLTGKHYSGDLEYEPGTGVKLELVPEE